jgi:carbonic anhydrase/acetyltransferase-like protein (isoleucine patch superfamily)
MKMIAQLVMRLLSGIKKIRIKKIISLYLGLRQDQDADVNIPLYMLKSFYCHLFVHNLFADYKTTIYGINNITINKGGMLLLGKRYSGFVDQNDRTMLRIKGKLIVNGGVSIGKGCRISIGGNAACTLNSVSINALTTLLVTHSLVINEGSTIAWGCEFSDEDFHNISYEGKKEKPMGIEIGRHVWVGSHVKILKGTRIRDNSVVAANSVVSSIFHEENVLIAGNPAKIIRRNIKWL